MDDHLDIRIVRLIRALVEGTVGVGSLELR